MIQFVLRHLDDEMKARLKRRAERHGRSMEEEVRQMLRNAVGLSNTPSPKLGSRIAARLAKAGLTEKGRATAYNQRPKLDRFTYDVNAA